MNRISRKQVIKYLERLAREIDKNDFWDFQAEWNSINNCVLTLKEIERNK